MSGTLPAPRVTPLSRAELPPFMQEAFDRAQQTRGDATFVQVMGHAPELLEWYGEFYQRVFYGGRVPARTKELLRLRLSTLHGCAFCNRGNRHDAREVGLTETQIRSIDDPSAACWSPAERAVLELASAMALTSPRGTLTDDNYRRLREHFDDAQIVELGITMAVLTGMAKFLFAFDLVEREDYCEFGVTAEGS